MNGSNLYKAAVELRKEGKEVKTMDNITKKIHAEGSITSRYEIYLTLLNKGFSPEDAKETVKLSSADLAKMQEKK